VNPDEEFRSPPMMLKRLPARPRAPVLTAFAERILKGCDIDLNTELFRNDVVELGDVSGSNSCEELLGLIRRNAEDDDDRKDNQKESDKYRQAGRQSRTKSLGESIIDGGERVCKDYGDQNPSEKRQDDQYG